LQLIDQQRGLALRDRDYIGW